MGANNIEAITGRCTLYPEAGEETAVTWVELPEPGSRKIHPYIHTLRNDWSGTPFRRKGGCEVPLLSAWDADLRHSIN